MGKIFEHTKNYIDNIHGIVLEIGSDRYEGSTEYFYNLAKTHAVDFHTVDIDSTPSSRLAHLQDINWHVKPGSKWCEVDLPLLDVQVGCVYLDNFDYNWDINTAAPWTEEQRLFYKKQLDIEMTNTASQIEHLKQCLALFPYLSEDAVIVCDDTYTYNDCWIGKCGAVVVYLLSQGFDIVYEQRLGDGVGVILKRGQ